MVTPMVEDTPKTDAFAACALVSATTYGWGDEDQRGRFDQLAKLRGKPPAHRVAPPLRARQTSSHACALGKVPAWSSCLRRLRFMAFAFVAVVQATP